MTAKPIALPEMGVVSALGCSREENWTHLFTAPEPKLTPTDQYVKDGTSVAVGRVPAGGTGEPDLPDVPDDLDQFDCRNNRMALNILEQFNDPLDHYRSVTDPERFGVVVGTSTSGVDEGVTAVREWNRTGTIPNTFDYHQMEMGGLAEFLGQYLDLHGARYSISTSCSSSAKVFGAARSLIRNDVCDVVLTGGVDTLTELTVNGFYSLQLISTDRSNPMSANRDGINLGEGGALFLMTEGTDGPCLLGAGESSDAYKMNAPDPEGKGAFKSMRHALTDANLDPGDVNYVNLHGTGTRQNDAMEAKAIDRLFDHDVACSSTKPFTGHTLGAAGALEAAFGWMMLERHANELPLPPHVWDEQRDEDLPRLNLVPRHESQSVTDPVLLSNSFAFGGNNCSIVLGDC